MVAPWSHLVSRLSNWCVRRAFWMPGGRKEGDLTFFFHTWSVFSLGTGIGQRAVQPRNRPQITQIDWSLWAKPLNPACAFSRANPADGRSFFARSPSEHRLQCYHHVLLNFRFKLGGPKKLQRVFLLSDLLRNIEESLGQRVVIMPSEHMTSNHVYSFFTKVVYVMLYLFVQQYSLVNETCY